jgi:ornithine cyclodeaminase
MPGCLESPPLYGAKLVSLHPLNPAAGRPAVQGFVALFDGVTGSPAALIDGAEITRLRTAAASALATRELARADAVTHGILGAGVQAASHLEAIACVRPIKRVRVWARNPARAREFADRHAAATGATVEAVMDPAAAAACDIVSVVTNAGEPVLRGTWLQPGAHLNLVGAHEPGHREVDSAAVVRAAVYVDSRAATLREAGDLLIPIGEGHIDAAHILGELGEVLEGRAPGRRNAAQVTLYKSLGIVAQDLYAAAQVLSAARATGAGTAVEFC